MSGNRQDVNTVFLQALCAAVKVVRMTDKQIQGLLFAVKGANDKLMKRCKALESRVATLERLCRRLQRGDKIIKG